MSPTSTDLWNAVNTPLRPDYTDRRYCSRVTWTSTNIREVPVPEKIPERGLTSL